MGYEAKPRDTVSMPPHYWADKLTPVQEAFVDWLVTPAWERDPKTQAAFAAQWNVTSAYLSHLKKEKKFQDAVSARSDEVNLSPDRVQEVMNALYKAATLGGDVKAMQLYLQHADKLKPKTIVIETPEVQRLSEDEIDKELRDLIASEEA